MGRKERKEERREGGREVSLFLTRGWVGSQWTTVATVGSRQPVPRLLLIFQFQVLAISWYNFVFLKAHFCFSSHLQPYNKLFHLKKPTCKSKNPTDTLGLVHLIELESCTKMKCSGLLLPLKWFFFLLYMQFQKNRSSGLNSQGLEEIRQQAYGEIKQPQNHSLDIESSQKRLLML